ncbi:MAG: porin [Myxococcales bacterium]
MHHRRASWAACRGALSVLLFLGSGFAARHASAQPANVQLVVPAPEAPILEAPVPDAPPPPATSPGPLAEPPPVAPPPPLAPPAPPAEPPHARLDYSDGTFYLRSVNDNIVFVPSGRMHIDTYAFSGPGVSDYHRSNGTGLKLNLFFRRFIIEFGGLIRKKWFYWMGGNFAPTQVDQNQAPLSSANVYDGFVGYKVIPELKVFFGQYNAPFTMENVTSSRWLDMMERALCIRTLATPYNKADGLTAWGKTPKETVEFQIGVFGGDGMNRPNVDNRVDGMGRIVYRPLMGVVHGALERFHLGIGGRYGSRDSKFVQYDAPTLSTPGGYAFWSPNYTAANGEKIHVTPTATQAAAGFEFYLPFERFDLRSEVIYVNEDRREVTDTNRINGIRSGNLWGWSGYGQFSWWIWGTPRINGNPATPYGFVKVPDTLGLEAPFALQLVLRGELVRVHYDGNSHSGLTPSGLSALTTNIFVNAFQAGINYWATKHIRLTAEYSLYQFPGGPDDNQAVSPGVKAGTAKGSHVLDEYSFRVGLAL